MTYLFNNFFFLTFFFLFSSIERPINTRRDAFFEACIRVPNSWDSDRTRQELVRAFTTFTSLFPAGGEPFEVFVTANAVVQSQRDGRLSFFHGLDFSESGRSDMPPLSLRTFHSVKTVGDVQQLPTTFPIEDFDVVFREALPNTTVFVKEIVNTVYIVRRTINDVSRSGGRKGGRPKFVKV